MRKLNEENERIKRRYLQYLKVAKRKDASTVQKAAEGILRFEASTSYATSNASTSSKRSSFRTV